MPRLSPARFLGLLVLVALTGSCGSSDAPPPGTTVPPAWGPGAGETDVLLPFAGLATPLEIETDRPQELAEQLAARLGPALIEADRLQFRCNKEPHELASLQAELALGAKAVRWRRPNLNDVFLWVNQGRVSQRRAA